MDWKSLHLLVGNIAEHLYNLYLAFTLLNDILCFLAISGDSRKVAVENVDAESPVGSL